MRARAYGRPALTEATILALPSHAKSCQRKHPLASTAASPYPTTCVTSNRPPPRPAVIGPAHGLGHGHSATADEGRGSHRYPHLPLPWFVLVDC
jgi:hypothetical protein